MTIRLRTAFFIVLGFILLGFLFIERAILAPFVLGAIFAYLINPIINFFTHRVRLPRTFSVILVYSLLLFIVVAISVLLTRRAMIESVEFSSYRGTLILTAKSQIHTLPIWLQPTLEETLTSLEKSKLFTPQSLFILFPQALSRVVSFIIFLFSSFYFLKEGRALLDKALHFVPNNYKIEIEIVARKINAVLGSYLRGQIFMVFLVSLTLFIALSILGVKFALILAIFSGIAEIVPIIGPIVATAVAALVTLLSGGSTNFPLTPIHASGIVVIIYVIVRQLQDYFVTPYIMRRITQLHPLIILFAALAGEHVAGILGIILGVPIAATLKIMLEYCLDKVNGSENNVS